MKLRERKILIVLAMATLLYVGSYFVLSLRGYYAPSAYGANAGGIKFYRWYVGNAWERQQQGKWAIEMIYAPLVFLDNRYWHTREKMWSMDYRIKFYYDSATASHKSHRM